MQTISVLTLLSFPNITSAWFVVEVITLVNSLRRELLIFTTYFWSDAWHTKDLHFSKFSMFYKGRCLHAFLHSTLMLNLLRHFLARPALKTWHLLQPLFMWLTTILLIFWNNFTIVILKHVRTEFIVETYCVLCSCTVSGKIRNCPRKNGAEHGPCRRAPKNLAPKNLAVLWVVTLDVLAMCMVSDFSPV